MKFVAAFFITLLFLCNAFGQEITESNIIKVMSFNIRCSPCEDSSSINHWSKRKQRIFKIIEKYNPDILGLQEADTGQIYDIVNRFNGYKWIGKGRDDGKFAGEFTAVLYKRDRFLLNDTYTYWLSANPSVPTKGWDAAYKRTVTIAVFLDLENESALCFFNTHFDHIGRTARIESAKLLRKYVREYSTDYPAILTGDFNFTENSRGYKVLTSGKSDPDSTDPQMADNPLLNSQYVSERLHTGGNITFNAFGKKTDIENPIDFIFVNERVKVESHQIITWLPEGLYPSDHFPVLVKVVCKTNK